MKKTSLKTTLRANASLARRLWGDISPIALKRLQSLTGEYSLSIQAGDLQFIEGKWYVTHSGLLRLATRRRCRGISTSLQLKPSDPTANRWVFRAVVYKSHRSRGFVGYAEADPGNVSSLIHGAELRIAETRAVNRALRKAYGIGLCSVEELGVNSLVPVGRQRPSAVETPPLANGNRIGQPRLRDQLCLLIRQFQLDPSLVKSYAADYCGTTSISAADRESVEAFVSHLKKLAEDNRDALICKLNSYTPAEVGT